MADITLEEALRLFDFPRVLGTFEDSDVSVAIGRFGPYVKHAGKFVSIPKDVEPAALSLDEAIRLIEDKRASEASRIVKTFPEDPTTQILNGRYGVYIASGDKNYKIPRSVVKPDELTLEQVRRIIAEQDQKPASTRTRKTTRKTKS